MTLDPRTIEACAKVADKIADEHAKWPGSAVSAYATKKVAAAIRALASETQSDRCSDCPPEGYPTNETRCEPCDRRGASPIREGGVESRHAKTGNMSGAAPEAEQSSSATSFVRASEEGLTSQARAGVATGPSGTPAGAIITSRPSVESDPVVTQDLAPAGDPLEHLKKCLRELRPHISQAGLDLPAYSRAMTIIDRLTTSSPAEVIELEFVQALWRQFCPGLFMTKQDEINYRHAARALRAKFIIGRRV